MKKEYKRARRRATRPWKILTWISAPITAILIALAVFSSVFDNSLSIFVGGTFNNIKNKDENAVYYKMDFDSQEEMVHYGEELCRQVEAEGAALLMNENDALPLAEGAKVSCFSNSSVNLVYGGTGSGNIDASTADTLKGSLEIAGFEVNQTLWDFYLDLVSAVVPVAVVISGSGQLEVGSVVLCGMVVYDVHHHTDSGVMKGLDHLLHLAYARSRIGGIGGIASLGRIVVLRVIAPVVDILLKICLVNGIIIIRGEDVHMCDTELLEMDESGLLAKRSHRAVFRKGEELAFVGDTGGWMHRHVAMVHLIEDYVREVLHFGSPVRIPAFRVCLVKIDDGCALSVCY